MRNKVRVGLCAAALGLASCGGGGDAADGQNKAAGGGAKAKSAASTSNAPTFLADAGPDDGTWSNVWKREQQASGQTVELKLALGHGQLSFAFGRTATSLRCTYFFAYDDRRATEVFLATEQSGDPCPSSLSKLAWSRPKSTDLVLDIAGEGLPDFPLLTARSRRLADDEIASPAMPPTVADVALGMTRREAERLLIKERKLTVRKQETLRTEDYVEYLPKVDGAFEQYVTNGIVVGYTRLGAIDQRADEEVFFIHRVTKPAENPPTRQALEAAFKKQYGDSVGVSGDHTLAPVGAGSFQPYFVGVDQPCLETTEYAAGDRVNLPIALRTSFGSMSDINARRIGCGPIVRTRSRINPNAGVIDFSVTVVDPDHHFNTIWANELIGNADVLEKRFNALKDAASQPAGEIDL